MSSYLDFDTTKKFRNFILGKTLTVPNGPQTFTVDSYDVQKTSDMSNVDAGDVEGVRSSELLKSQNSNVFKPLDYFVNENFNTIPRKANLSLYPYFVGGQDHNIVSIMSTTNYDTESALFKFAAWNMQNNIQGPFFGRTQQNLYNATVGKIRLIDALQGNTATAINIITGKEPLIESNPKITVARELPGKVIDFLQTVTGVEFPWSEIPGDYLTNPNNPVNVRPKATTEGGALAQDVFGNLGELIGIQRRPKASRKPSDLLIEYSGERQKSTLFHNLSFSTYAPDYTTTARSQNSSKVFNFVDKTAQSVKSFLGLEAPRGIAYIGDDRGNDVKYATNDDNDRPVKSSYYLNLMFDPIQTELFERPKNISEGGSISGKLTWISSKSKNKLGENNAEFTSEESQYNDTLSTNHGFRKDSILGITQEILETLPSDGGASRSHIANVIDQTSRVFREGDIMMSKGSAIKYIDKYTGTESGVEYCRAWTKDRSYMNNSDTMKRTTLSRKFGSSVLSTPWNLNIYPNSNGNGGFDNNSTNMSKGMGNGFYAKKYMFSVENLAWKSSNTKGFTYNELPYCERGPNGGRIMWFPPYDLKVNEQNSAKWEENVFLGRPEPVYTYQNTSRAGSISFKVIVDHPSILNLLVKDHFKNMSDEEADNYINAFFAGCEDVDFYGMIRKYTTLTEDDVKKIQSYLNGNKDTNTIRKYKTLITPPVGAITPKNDIKNNEYKTALYFKNDYPDINSTSPYTFEDYSTLYTDYKNYKTEYLRQLDIGLATFDVSGWTGNQQTNYFALTKQTTTSRPIPSEITAAQQKARDEINKGFLELDTSYQSFINKLTEIKDGLNNKTIRNISMQLGSSTSSIADPSYNLSLSYRRSWSIIRDILGRISKTEEDFTKIIGEIKWKTPPVAGEIEKTEPPITVNLKDLGYDVSDGAFVIDYIKNTGEQPVHLSSGEVKNVTCTEAYKIVGTSVGEQALKKTAPNTFWCRESIMHINYEPKESDEVKTNPDQNGKTVPTTVEITDTPTGIRTTPPIDEMKRIVMKTLSECYYFKKLEEESPIQFSSLKEKLRYFHPAFHSMTPEGLNSRLTFLQQCIRPGETIPIKGISDSSDLYARNTTFGPPPICVMRIGDFYHSKIAIRDVNIDYENNLWDLNPEGIGVQPMIANVTLQVNFIGGHGLSKPVEKLQNALSSNFYANTEIYDPRSISTETTIDGKDASTFTKEFLEELVKDNTNRVNTTSQNVISTPVTTSEGLYIGNIQTFPGESFTAIDYKPIVTKLFNDVSFYFGNFKNSYDGIVKKYDKKISSLLLSPTYRKVKDYTVQKGSGTENLELLGEYKQGSELLIYIELFKSQILDKIETENISTLFGFNKDLTPPILARSEEVLKPYVKTTISSIIDGLTQIDVKKTIEYRNNLIQDIDKLNFIIEMGHDAKIESLKNKTYTSAALFGYNYGVLYSTYSNVISFIKTYHNEFKESLDETYAFNVNTIMTTNDLSYFLSVLLKGSKERSEILDLYKKDPMNFSPRVQNDISKRLDKFLAKDPTDKKFTFEKHYPQQKDNNPITFRIDSENIITNQSEIGKLINVNTSSGSKLTNVLNYYRPKTI